MRRIVLGNDQKPRRVLIDAVHDAGAHFPVDGTERFQAEEQRVDERSVRSARARMDRHAARLVDDGDVAVFIQNVHGEVLRLRPHGAGRRDVERHAGARFQHAARPDGHAVRKQPSLVRQLFDGRARQPRLFTHKDVRTHGNVCRKLIHVSCARRARHPPASPPPAIFW